MLALDIRKHLHTTAKGPTLPLTDELHCPNMVLLVRCGIAFLRLSSLVFDVNLVLFRIQSCFAVVVVAAAVIVVCEPAGRL